MGWVRSRVVCVVAVLAVVGPVAALAACPGDCDGDGVVPVDEVLAVVAVLLASEPLEACGSADHNGDGKVAINEAVLAVQANLNGCPSTCGDGIVEGVEECDVGDPEVRCYSDCTSCCRDDDCVLSKCCRVGEDGFVDFDPDCRECGELDEGCGGSTVAFFGCCTGLSCWEWESHLFPYVSGTCCPSPGSPCEIDSDCCRGLSYPFTTPPDACVDGACCVPRGAVCSTSSGPRGSCCDRGDRCCPLPMGAAGWGVCCGGE